MQAGNQLRSALVICLVYFTTMDQYHYLLQHRMEKTLALSAFNALF